MGKRVFIVIIALLISAISFVAGTCTNTKNHLNMNTVVGFDATEYGVMLYTSDGNGYYIEK